MPEVPHIPKDIMDYLSAIYPDRSPEVDTPDRHLWVNVGTVKVVRHLRRLYEEQQEDVLRSNK